MNYIVTKQTKSKGIAIILVALFGPLGLFYSTITGGIIMTIVVPACLYGLLFLGIFNHSELTLLVFIAGALLSYIICFIWAVGAVNDYNYKIINEANIYQSYRPMETKENIYENLERIQRLYENKVLPERDYQVQKEEYLLKIKRIDKGDNEDAYRTEYERYFTDDNKKGGYGTLIIAILILALIASWYFVSHYLK
jgi:hypothetical protein